MNSDLLGMAAALGSAASWALGSVLFKLLGERLPPVSLTFAKGVVGTILLGLVLGTGGMTGIEAWPLTLLVLSGLLGIAIGDTLFFIALRNLGAHAVVVLLTLGQVLTVLLAFAWLGERPSPTAWFGIGLVVTGVTIVLWLRLSEEGGSSTLVGVAWGLASVICMAVSIIIAKEALDQTDSMQAAFIRMLTGTVGVFLFGQMAGQIKGTLGCLFEPRFAALFLIAVAVVTFGGFWLSLAAIERIDVTIANTLGSTEPLFVLPLAAFVLKETITRTVVLGSALAVCGIAVILSST
jgi:drug/metabolite transporter (DMT)-like permease